MHWFHIHEFGDLSKDCSKVGPIYSGFEELVRSSSRGLGNFYDWNDNVALDGADSILGRSVVIHDDLNVKTKLACGIIQPGDKEALVIDGKY